MGGDRLGVRRIDCARRKQPGRPAFEGGKPLTTRVTLVCATPTAANRAFAFPGDEPAEPKALAKLPPLADHLPHADWIFTSPARAARQSAQALGLTATVEPLLRDCDYGRWTGRTLSVLEAEEPTSILEWMQDPTAAPHDGESIADVIARTRQWLTALGDGQILAITHAAVIRAALVCALDMPPSSFWRIDAAPLSTVRLSGAHGRWNLSALEDL